MSIKEKKKTAEFRELLRLKQLFCWLRSLHWDGLNMTELIWSSIVQQWRQMVF